MTIYFETLLLLAVGITTVTVIDSLGSITSRKWRYNYALLSPLSFLVYTAIGYFGYIVLGSSAWVFIIAALVGIYDSTIGWRISTILNANFGKFTQTNRDMKLSERVFGMIIVSVLFAFFGFILSGGSLTL